MDKVGACKYPVEFIPGEPLLIGSLHHIDAQKHSLSNAQSEINHPLLINDVITLLYSGRMQPSD